MPDDNWMDETVPSGRVDRANGRATEGRSTVSQIPPRVWAFAFVAAILLFALFGLWALYLFRGRFSAPGPTPTAIIWTPTPSPTPAITDTPTPTGTAASETPNEATPTASADITIGGYVTVVGTAGYGLSLREGPGANYARMDVAAEEEVFIVVEGPQTAGGSPWWRIRDPDNEERTWWAIGNYLQPVEHP
jgi:hypothetical protein